MTHFVPPALAARAQFVPLQADKLPVLRADGRAHLNAMDPANWMSYEAAKAHPGAVYVGFVLTEADPFWCLDIDKQFIEGAWSPLAADMVARFPGAYVEVSLSGTGLHIFGSGAIPEHACRSAPLELYSRDRYVALTGIHAQGDPSTRHDEALAALVAERFMPGPAGGVEWSDEGPRPEWDGPTDDAELLAKAMASQSPAQAFGSKASFGALWDGEVEGDASANDLALLSALAFWTGCDMPRMERLFGQSALGQRAKWTERPDYRERSITRVCEPGRAVYQARRQPAPMEAAPAGPAQYVTGGRVVHSDGLPGFFAGCVYVADRKAVLTPNGAFLTSDQFKVLYGGYEFKVREAGKQTTTDAFEAFTQSQVVAFPKVHRAEFRPEMAPGTVYELGNVKCVNSYVPIPVRREAGDPSRVLNHLARLLPDKGDRDVVLAYMAACVQHKGVKFQWCPVLQGVPGNGKTLLSACVEHAVGLEHTYRPEAKDLGDKFNDWLDGCIFASVEDVRIAEHQEDLMEAVKPMITNERLQLQGKGTKKVTQRICTNFIMNMNRKDGIRKNRNDRRFAIFYTAQQSQADVHAAGMGGDYFPDLYDWLNGRERYADLGPGYGFAVLAEYLHTYPIPAELNPARGLHRAPRTSSTEEAIAEGMGSIEHLIAEAISEGVPGFQGGWLNWKRAADLVRPLRVGHRALRAAIEGMGYVPHPALAGNNGYTREPPVGEATKVRLYVLEGRPVEDNYGSVAINYANAQIPDAVKLQ